MSYDNLGFERVTIPNQTGVLATYARFRCNACRNHADLLVKTGKPLDPEGLAKRLSRTGWQAHAFKKSKVYCPKCIGPSKNHDVDSELRKVKTLPPSTAPITVNRNIIPPPQTAKVEVKDPTPDQRSAIRGHLEKHFDDSTGMYLDDMSDQRIAELVGVPRIIVSDIRDKAYGPIRVDPALAPLRTELDLLRNKVDHYSKLGIELQAAVREIGSKIEKTLAGMAR